MRAIGQWVAEHAEEVGPLLGLPPDRVPCPATLRRAVRAVDLAALEAQIAAFVAQLPTPPAPPRADPPPAPPVPWVGLALDGKAVRGANRHGTQVHLVGLVRHDDGRVLGQVAVADKSNEITAAPRLLAGRDLRGTVTTVDALLTQRELARQIRRQGGHYLMVVKANQPAMLAAIATVFDRPPLPLAADAAETVSTCDKGHGRLDLRTLERSAALNGYLAWPAVGQVLRRTCQRVHLATGEIEEEVTYGVCSLAPAEASAAQLEALWRGHWTIENRVHRVRDATWGGRCQPGPRRACPTGPGRAAQRAAQPAACPRLDPDRRCHPPLRRLRPTRHHLALNRTGTTLTPPYRPQAAPFPGPVGRSRRQH
jgi:predicted transposase YbfD/YdcC